MRSGSTCRQPPSVVTAKFVCCHVKLELSAGLSQFAVGVCAFEKFKALADGFGDALSCFFLRCLEQVGRDVNCDFADFVVHAISYAIKCYGIQNKVGLLTRCSKAGSDFVIKLLETEFMWNIVLVIGGAACSWT